jgi:hypothetical protein
MNVVNCYLVPKISTAARIAFLAACHISIRWHSSSIMWSISIWDCSPVFEVLKEFICTYIQHVICSWNKNSWQQKWWLTAWIRGNNSRVSFKQWLALLLLYIYTEWSACISQRAHHIMIRVSVGAWSLVYRIPRGILGVLMNLTSQLFFLS